MEKTAAAAEKKRVALTSVIAALFITFFKLIVGLKTNSLGILSEAAHSGLDLVAALMTLAAVTISEKPADREHQYGHGKIENLSAFLETVLLVITCAWIIWEAVDRLSSGTHHVEVTVWSFVVIIVAVAVDISRSRALGRVARKHNSQALEADALHFSSDVWSSLVVLFGLGCVALGIAWVDSAAAITVALLVLFVSYRLGKRTIDALMDRVPEGASARFTEAAGSVEGVEEVRTMRIRPSGAKLFVDTTVAIRRTTPFQRAHIIMDLVEKAIHAVSRDADVVVHAEPFEPIDETVADKIRMIVEDRGLSAPHNLEVYRSEGKHQVDFDIEYTGGKSFVEAHELSAAIENDIKAKIPSVEKVTIHMEEHPDQEQEIRNQTFAARQLRERIRTRVLADKRIIDCTDVTLRQSGSVYNVSLTCTFRKTMTLDEVHQVISELESRLHSTFAILRRVTVHAEPG